MNFRRPSVRTSKSYRTMPSTIRQQPSFIQLKNQIKLSQLANKKEKPSYSSVTLSQKSLIPHNSDRCYKVKITVLSNYGDPQIVSCSKIDFFDINNCKVKVFDAEPEEDVKMAPLDLLTNGVFNTTDTTTRWTCQWNEQPFSLIFSVCCDTPLETIRIWSGSSNLAQSIKEVEVFIGDRFVNKATIPDIGGNIRVQAPNSIQITNSRFQINRTGYFIKDKFGEIPNIPVSCLEIDLYPEREHMLGLNQLEIYNTKGDLVKPEYGDQNSFLVFGARNMFPAMNIFKDDKHSCDVESMWSALITEGDHVTLQFNFKPRENIAYLRFFNHNSCFTESMYQTSWARVKVNGDVVWRGQLKRARGMSKGISKDATCVFLTDCPFAKGTLKKEL
jgi:hypothetical protein